MPVPYIFATQSGRVQAQELDADFAYCIDVATSPTRDGVFGTVTADRFIVTANNVNPQSGTTYTLQATDSGKFIKFTTAVGATVTVPAGLPAGFGCLFAQYGTGLVTLAAAGGVSLNSVANALTTVGQFAQGIIAFDGATDSYSVGGNLTP